MKSYRVTATFPELPAAHAVQEARGQGSTLSVGIKRALDAILGERHVKGRRISTVKLFVRVEQIESEPQSATNSPNCRLAGHRELIGGITGRTVSKNPS